MHRQASLVVQFCLLVLGAAQQLRCIVQEEYHLSPYRSNWFEAVEYCNKLGLRLALVDTAAKHDALVQEAKATGRQSTGYFGIWLGASDLARTNSYVWHGTGARVTFARWKAGEPSGGNEHCMNLLFWPQQGFNWTWNDAPCDSDSFAACEKDPNRCNL